MLSERIKYFRKQKGFTQEELAIRLNVVRQTVSKWEKGLSVPDSDLLIKLAEVLEVDVTALLGGEIMHDNSSNEIVEQLARINEQLAVKNRRARRIWKIIAGVLIAGVAVVVICFCLLVGLRAKTQDRSIAGTTSYSCTLDGKEYSYEIRYNSNYEIIEAGGDSYIGYAIDAQSDANEFDFKLKEYFKEKGGTVKVVSSSGNALAAN